MRVRVGGMNKSFQCSGPVPGQAAKASKKKKVVHQNGDAFPFAARTRTDVQDRSACGRGVKNLEIWLGRGK